jgi:hypothetical protein
MNEKAKQVKVQEEIENNVIYTFGAILIGDKLIAMDNGDILDANADHIKILDEYSWIDLSTELIGG